MKKVLGVIVAITLCMSLFIPMASAADDSDSLLSLFDGLDVESLNVDEISSVLSGLDLGDLDVDSLLADIEGGDTDALGQLDSALQGLGSSNSTDDDSDADESEESLVGGLDLSFLTDALAGVMDADTLDGLTSMFSGLSSTDTGSLMTTISDALAGLGVDSSKLKDMDVGSFDVSALGGANASEGSVDDVSSTVTNGMASFMDTMLGGLTALGLDTSVVEGMLDNDIVNFFANMYVGFIGGEADPEPETTEATTEATTVPAVVTTKTPDTGDTSSVIVALGVLSASAAAAFVCTKKKED